VCSELIAADEFSSLARVLDTDFTTDLTIMEKGHELLKMVKEGGTLPLITSCSPGWIKFCEHFYHDFLDNVSICKSPQQMFCPMAKTYPGPQPSSAPQAELWRHPSHRGVAALIVKERELAHTLSILNGSPDIVVCDSQVVLKMFQPPHSLSSLQGTRVTS
jgi:hypothetical protein